MNSNKNEQNNKMIMLSFIDKLDFENLNNYLLLPKVTHKYPCRARTFCYSDSPKYSPRISLCCFPPETISFPFKNLSFVVEPGTHGSEVHSFPNSIS